MTRPRPPVVAGIAGGSGARTLTAALHAVDGGRLSERRRGPGGADVVVCSSAPGSVSRAEALVGPVVGPRPVLALTLDAATGPTDALGPRLCRRFAAVVLVPHVARWRRLTDPTDEAASVLARPAGLLPGDLRAYAHALRLVVAALLESGLLQLSGPPAVTAARSVEPWRGLQPVARSSSRPPELISAVVRPVLVRPVLVRPLAAAPARPAAVARTPALDGPAAPPRVELDDEAIEAGQGQISLAGRAG